MGRLALSKRRVGRHFVTVLFTGESATRCASTYNCPPPHIAVAALRPSLYLEPDEEVGREWG
jgi:hypothetical protein